MIDLNNVEEIKKLDPKNTFGSVEMLADQCNQMWEEGKTFKLPDDYRNVKNVVICGMGGSAYGGYIVRALYSLEMKVPYDQINDYRLPAYVNSDTLVIATSYSGTTEEVLSCLSDAMQKGAKIVTLSAGGTLAEEAKKNNLPFLVFEPKFNPSNQPRLAPGYIVTGTLSILSQLGFISLSDEEMKATISEMRDNTDTIKGKAQEIAKKIEGYIPVIFASEFLIGNAHIMRNQFNETAKSFSAYEDVPELNHHLMEGLKNPSDRKLKTLFLESSLYSEKHSKRIQVTKDVVTKNNVEHLSYEASGSSKLSQSFNVLSFGGYLTLYLALIYGLDPSLIPWVDYFKEQLSK